MKKIKIRFEEDSSLGNGVIELVVRAAERDEETEELIGKLSTEQTDSIQVTDGSGRFDVIPFTDIIMLSAEGKQVTVITADNRYIARQPLKSIEEMLVNDKFLKISRYDIINLGKVVQYDFTLSGTLRIELMGGIETWASRRCIPLIRRRLTGKG